MHMSTMERRLHLLLDEARYRKVSTEAQRQGISVAAVVRQAIDRLPPSDQRRREAIDAILAATPIPVPADPADLRRELDGARDRIP
jgi:hypothetical protein